MFLLTTMAIDRERPDVEKLDQSPPTSSFPSGHTGASSALYFGLAIICATQFERRWLRVLLGVGFALIPFAVATARLYRGMHHPSRRALRDAQRPDLHADRPPRPRPGVAPSALAPPTSGSAGFEGPAPLAGGATDAADVSAARDEPSPVEVATRLDAANWL